MNKRDLPLKVDNHKERFDIFSELEEFTASSVKSVAFDFLRLVTFISPVDTGRFRANWVVGVNQTSEAVNERLRSVKETQNRGKKIINSAPDDLSTVIWISNNLPYAQRLNNGWSEQAPKHFVEQAARKAGINIKDGEL